MCIEAVQGTVGETLVKGGERNGRELHNILLDITYNSRYNHKKITALSER